MLLFFINSFSQDTIKILQYNLLYYGLNNDYCNSNNNDIVDKTNYLKQIISYSKPDIFAVNEINDKENVQDYLLGNVFLLNDFQNYSRAEITHQYLTDQIYFNNTKLRLKKQFEIINSPRIISVYKLYYNSPDIQNGDTVFIYYILAHLKAGNNTTDSTNRVTEVTNIMDFVKTEIPQNSNVILSGDLNLYTSNEEAYKILTNNTDSSYNFNDPGLEGDWHDNILYSQFHTQSTRDYDNGCASSGGMDDRFDFILFSNSIKSGLDKIYYISNSFQTIGQDGNHFNQSIDFNSNTSVPSNILSALTNNSDHLPISISLFINQNTATNRKKDILTKNFSVFYKNGKIVLKINNIALYGSDYNINIYTTKGICIYKDKINLPNTNINYYINFQMNPGIYFIKLKNQKNIFINKFYEN